MFSPKQWNGEQHYNNALIHILEMNMINAQGRNLSKYHHSHIKLWTEFPEIRPVLVKFEEILQDF